MIETRRQDEPGFPAPKSSATHYHPQLDGLRAIAVGFVMAWHFLPLENAFRDGYRWGWFGVRMFFVLSGFLISSILLREKQAEQPLGQVLKAFYARRALRIFPLYYAYVGLLLILTSEMATYFGWFALYLNNILMFRTGDSSIVPGASILWTLAIEEPFYLAWPLVLLLTPRRHLPLVMATCVIVGLVSRTYFRFGLGYSVGVSMVFPTSNLDSLVMGSCLAFARLHGKNQDRLTRYIHVGGLLGICFIILQCLLWNFADIRLEDSFPGKLNFVVSDFFASLFFIFAIDAATRQKTGWIGTILRNRVIIYVGRISYGIYVLHMFAGQLVWRGAARFGFTDSERDLVLFLPCVVASIIAASISWALFESPINNLKRLFPYPRL